MVKQLSINLIFNLEMNTADKLKIKHHISHIHLFDSLFINVIDHFRVEAEYQFIITFSNNIQKKTSCILSNLFIDSTRFIFFYDYARCISKTTN